MNQGSGAGPTGASGGLFAALRATATTLLATARTHVELAGNELESELRRLLHALVFAIAALFCCGLGILLLVGLVLALHWDDRIVVLAVLAAIFLIAGALLVVGLLRATRRRRVFAATLAELEEDLRQLRAATSHVQSRD